MKGFIVFSDIYGFSNLNESELKLFYEKFVSEISPRIDQFRRCASIWHTQWDSITAVFENIHDAVDFMFEYRNIFKNYKFDSIGISVGLSPRILGHFSDFQSFNIQSMGFSNIIIKNINTIDKISLSIPPGEIFVSEDFIVVLRGLNEKIPHIKINEFGNVPVGSNFGEMEIFGFHKDVEIGFKVNKFRKIDNSLVLPTETPMSEYEVLMIKRLNSCTSTKDILDTISTIDLQNKTGNFLILLANIYKKIGYFDKAFDLIENIRNDYTIESNGFVVHPYKYNTDILKFRADCLYKLGMYKESDDDIYGMLKLNPNDKSLILLLAEQYKKRSLYDKNGEFLNIINRPLLYKSKDLYLECFRNNINDLSVAINVCYIYRIIGKLEVEKGKKLASYIFDTLQSRSGESWVIDSTLCSSCIILDNYIDAIDRLTKAMYDHKVDINSKYALYEQINSYAKFTNRQLELKNILDLLKVN